MNPIQTVLSRRIQYAKANRWQPPKDLASEIFPNSSFHATSFGPCCRQRYSGLYIPEQDEQCLYLNIFTPINKTKESLMPVLVWIHGGGLISGCSSQSIPIIYNGTNIIANSPQQQVIVVTLNYRLGVLAEMYLQELIDENPKWPAAGNYNYLDILSALRWIKMNIRDYGGHSENILLFGESSGGRAVYDMGALKGTSNLYQHMISQSGGFSSSRFYSNTTSAMERSKLIVEKMNCTGGSSKTVLPCLRNSSIDDLIIAYGDSPLKSVIDHDFFPQHPELAIQDGKYNQNISMIIGANKYEDPYYPTYRDMNSTLAMAIVTDIFGSRRAPTVLDHYQLPTCSPHINGANRCSEVLHVLIRTMIGCTIRRIYNHLYFNSNQPEQQRLFWYNMDCNPGICPHLSIEEGAGLCLHAAEIPFVFGTESNYASSKPINCSWDSQTRSYSNEIISHWVSMSARGTPLKPWPAYHPSTSKYFHLTPY